MNQRINEKGQEVFTKPSKTVPGMAYTIPELIKRLSQGIPVKRVSMEYSDDEEPVFVPKDLTDIDVMTNKVIQSKQHVQSAVKNKKDAELLKAKSEEIEREVQNRLKGLKGPTG